MSELPDDTEVIHTAHSTTYHRPDDTGHGNVACGADILNPSRSEIQYLPWYEPCGSCYPVVKKNTKQATID